MSTRTSEHICSLAVFPGRSKQHYTNVIRGNGQGDRQLDTCTIKRGYSMSSCSHATKTYVRSKKKASTYNKSNRQDLSPYYLMLLHLCSRPTYATPLWIRQHRLLRSAVPRFSAGKRADSLCHSTRTTNIALIDSFRSQPE